MKHQLTRGQALVLAGPQGCGKSTLAREIAAAYGSYREIDAEVLSSPFQLGNILSEEPKTLVVEGLPEREDAIFAVKEMLTNETTIAHRKGLEPVQVKTPNFIFCSGAIDPLDFDQADRRFYVIEMESGK